MDAHLETPPLSFSITDTDAGERLDAFLAKHVEGWSRARLQRLIEDQSVLVNGVASKPSHKLRPNDQIEVDLTPAPTTAFVPEDIPIEVVFEDDDLIVVNKPAGMVVHPAAGISSGTLANALAFHFQQLAQRGGGEPSSRRDRGRHVYALERAYPSCPDNPGDLAALALPGPGRA